MNSYKFIVSGKVQGVYYRKTIANNAKNKKFKGYVKNLPNGCVEALISCKKTKLDEFNIILKNGSKLSEVQSIKCIEVDYVNFNDFTIR